MSEKLLIVDDDPGWASLSSKTARRAGFDVEIVATKKEAILKLKGKKVVVTDLHLEESSLFQESNAVNRDGYDIARQAKKMKVPHVVIASSTATPSEQIADVEIISKSNLGDWLSKILK